MSEEPLHSESGPYYENFVRGTKFLSKVGRTITETDNIWFTLLTNNNNQIHFNKDYVQKTFPGEPFNGKLVVNGFLILAIVAGLLVEYTSVNGFMLGLENLKFLRPVFEGDTIYAECTISDIRESNKYPQSGIVKVSTSGFNQRKEKIVEFDRTFMVRKKGSVWSGERKNT